MGLRDSIPVGSALTMLAGSAAQVLLAWEEPDRLHRGLQGARFTATTLSARRVWNAPALPGRNRTLGLWALAQGVNALWLAARP